MINLPSALEDMGYLAAMIDAEGHISRKGRARGTEIRPGRWVVGVANTSWSLMEWLSVFGGIIRPKSRTERQQPAWEWLVLARRDQIALLRLVLPHLRIKADRANLALQELLALEGAPTEGGTPE